MALQLQGTDSAALALKRVRYTHDAMIDLIVANPGISQNDLAKHFGYSVPWISRVINSDAFGARLAQRKTEIVDPELLLTVEEKFRALAHKSLEVVMDRLNQQPTMEHGMMALEISAKALGYGARAQNVNVQNNFVVALPQKVVSADEWAARGKQAGLEAGQQSPQFVERLEN
jgi:hypothetical protein